MLKLSGLSVRGTDMSSSLLFTVWLGLFVMMGQITTANATPGPPTRPKVILEFQLVQLAFTPDLANTSSPAFQNLATLVASVINNVYMSKFSNFNRTVVTGFSSGSVKVEAELIFNQEANATAPNASSVANALVEAASSSNFPLPVNTSSIVVTGGILRFASYYGDHMVLQRSPERAVLWGYGPDGAQVTISLSGPVTQKPPPVMVTKGIWRLTLGPVEAGGPYNVTAALGDTTVTLADVLFGDVWLCGGQSNMEFETSQIFNASEELVLAVKYPHVRLFMAALELSTTELTDLARVELPWSVPTAKIFPGDLFHFSAVCWLYGRYMYDTLKYPVGLVESCWGGTPVEAWSSPRALHQCDLLEVEDSPKRNNSVLWNAMVHPLLNMTLKGAIWYQGEDNTKYNQEKYSCSFPAMIDDWRMAFHEGSGGQTASDLPFGFVQLSTFIKGSTDEGFPNIRWHQTADYGFAPNPRMKKTFMAVAMDLPDETSPFGTIHPRDKQDVAYRLMLGARAVAYGEKDVAFQGPFPEQILASEAYLNITFNQKISVTPSKDIFQICCSAVRAPCGHLSVWLPAPIVHWYPTVVQVSTSMCQPAEYVAGLQYAWEDWPCDFKACPIYSDSGVLPAAPFRINRWPAAEMSSSGHGFF